MKPLTKTLVYGGAAVAVLGGPLVASAVVSLAQGTGTFAGVLIEDGLPSLTDGFQQYEGGTTPGLFDSGPDEPAGPLDDAQNPIR